MSLTPNISLSIGSFLPLSKMAELAKSSPAIYKDAKPFPHLVFDNFLDPALLDQVLAEFPTPDQINWHRFDNEKEIKLASTSESAFGPMTRLLLYHLNSATFLDFMSAVTGIPRLIADPYFEGGGL